MISFELMLYCVLSAGAYLLLLSLLLDWVERKLKLSAMLPDEMVESTGLSWTLANFTMEVPFYGVRAGVASGLFAFGLGAVPGLIGLAVRVKLPTPFMFYILLSILLKLIGCLAIIGYLYTL